ncbi:predicted protein [Botrytis cinerea T4]|uniref:Uncharacterized protein n=1 Tax=Botryotinia fuckeliana (strain T4) TaxID=999810 RepID=G2YVD7_BOTF4|nr:predicted protein [Botrytis cinerea T4]
MAPKIDVPVLLIEFDQESIGIPRMRSRFMKLLPPEESPRYVSKYDWLP